MHAKYYSGRKADIWALGLCVFALIFGQMPYECTQRDKIVRSVTELDLASCMRLQTRTVSSKLHDFLSRMLALNPAERWNADQLRKHPFLTGAKL